MLFFCDAPIHITDHQAPQDDLATAGLGSEGLSSPTPPPFRDPSRPTPSELRRRAIYENYRAIADTSTGGGFGAFFGPGVGLDKNGAKVPELISGREYRGLGTDNCDLLLQIPNQFNPNDPVLLLVPASSSRGVYGGIFIAEWALKKGYAVALTDKGAGIGFHDLSPDKVALTNGTVEDRKQAGACAAFQVPDDSESLDSFCQRHPNRIALKHAHSGYNVESKWGEYVLESAEFAFHILSNLYPGVVNESNTLVMASGVSNGGGAALQAAELDLQGLIDGVAVGEPNVTPEFDPSFVIQYSERPALERHSRTLLEYASVQNLYQPVANLSSTNRQAPFNPDPSANRLRSLQNFGLWKGLSTEDAALAAQQLIHDFGLLAEQDFLAPSHCAWGLFEGICVNTASCYGGFKVSEHLLGLSYSAIDPEDSTPRALTESERAALATQSNGVVPTSTLHVICDRSMGGPVQSIHSISPSSGICDQNLDAALNLVALAQGSDILTGKELEGVMHEQSQRILYGMEQLKTTGNLHQKPSIIVNGRCDSIIAPNHASRAYLGKNLCTEKHDSKLAYLEVVHAQHLDALNALAEFAVRYVPLAPYLFRALDQLENHLRNGEELPPSQIIRSNPRIMEDGKISNLGLQNIPFQCDQPDPGDLIKLVNGVLIVPQ